ncbi:MAG TPA: PD-(D/E)XK nuclease family protein [Actinomycetota bacterium]
MELTAVQERALVDLLGRDHPRPVFATDLPARLAALIEDLAAPALGRLREGEAVWMSKTGLADLHTRCEGLYQSLRVEHEGEFTLSLPLAVGNVVHRAIEADVVGARLGETELAEKAVARLRRSDTGFDRFVQTLDELDQAWLVSEAARRIALFRGTMPPLQRAWTPIPELRVKAELAGGRLVLSGAVDLSLFRPNEDQPTQATRLFLELKTGSDRPEHVDDLRFYALAATLRFGVPPFRLATLLLDDGTYRPEDVTEDVLEAASRRVAGAVLRHVELMGEREPVLRPGPWCRWCPRAETCPEAQV